MKTAAIERQLTELRDLDDEDQRDADNAAMAGLERQLNSAERALFDAAAGALDVALNRHESILTRNVQRYTNACNGGRTIVEARRRRCRKLLIEVLEVMLLLRDVQAPRLPAASTGSTERPVDHPPEKPNTQDEPQTEATDDEETQQVTPVSDKDKSE